MALSNHERVGKALELLNEGLKPYILREMQAVHGPRAAEEARGSLRSEVRPPGAGESAQWDTQALLTIMWDQWNTVFRNTLGFAERSMVSELREWRNKWAHQQAITTDDSYRALDSVSRLLTVVNAPEQATEVERHKQEVLRLRFEEQAKRETRRASVAAVEGKPMEGLKPWREIITPHPDVASGNYQQAEFAADLGQVYRGEGSPEYLNPRDFFARTFITEGLKHLLGGALQRLGGTGGDPVVELQTNFGGGKTHSMLALYHLFSDVPASDLAGIEPVLKETGANRPSGTKRAVLVGTALNPAQPTTKPDGTVVRTFWGELGWQLLGSEGYALVAEADRQGVSPGSDTLRELFTKASPCLILIDEWVAYVRNLYGIHGLPSGSFEANLTFAQALTEAAKAAPRTLLVASIPASDIEIGGHAGREALERLRNTFGRIESSWRPASAEEGFEIVRRRLFQPIAEPGCFASRDSVVRAFTELYRAQPQEFPADCREGDYARRLEAAYPIHPELFDRLYTDWSSLDKFQRTRGVLRLMAAVIHSLWERNDTSLLIMPASVPIDENTVQFELARYVEETWVPVIEKDVDGPNSLPLRLDRENPNFGRYSACRRVARTLFIGSAPTLQMAHKGLEDRQIKLGCVQPGEQVATFGDALRRLTDNAAHLYVDGHRYWYSTQPSVTRIAQDRASQMSADAVLEEMRARLRVEGKTRGDFSSVHVCPPTSADIADEREARLVVLDPSHAHVARTEDSPARKAAADILDHRGSGPRLYRNTLVFLAADKTRLDELDQAVRQYLSWKSIDQERLTLNLDAFQSNQARTKRDQAEGMVKARIPETYSWLIVPFQTEPQAPPEWQEIKLQGQDEIAVRAAKKLRNEELLVLQLAGTRLRYELDRIPLWRGEGDHVGLKQLADDFAQYLYLPRVKDAEVLVAGVRDGVNRLNWEDETFAYADSHDAQGERYIGLKAGELATIVLDTQSMIVKPDTASKQIASDTAAIRKDPDQDSTAVGGTSETGGGTRGTRGTEGTGTGSTGGGGELTEVRMRRFHGSITLDPKRLNSGVGTISQEVVQHLAGLVGAQVEITIEISAFVPGGAPDHVVRTVTENCRTLNFASQEFEPE